MSNAKFVLVSLVLAIGGACYDEDNDPKDRFEDTVDDFSASYCEAARCLLRGDVSERCETSTIDQLTWVKSQLNAAEQAQCVACLEVRIKDAEEILSSGCLWDNRPDNEAEIARVCDTDPTVDTDNDGDPANDDNEACAGMPGVHYY